MNLPLLFTQAPLAQVLTAPALAAQALPAQALAAQPPQARCPPAAPEQLHPALWRASQLGASRLAVTPSGFAELDAQLPGGGWPHGALTELLLPHPGLGELRLLAPALAAVAGLAASPGGPGAPFSAPAPSPAAATRPAAEPTSRCVMLFDPPASLSGCALAPLGLDGHQLLVVRGRPPHGRPAGAAEPPPLLPSADLLWALEQALKSGHVGAVLAWLPARLRADALRRLQLAAQAHGGPVFLFRELPARLKPSAAPLRLVLQAGGVDMLLLRLLKRRGPPLLQPLRLALPPVLTPAHGKAFKARQRRDQALAAADAAPAPWAQHAGA